MTRADQGKTKIVFPFRTECSSCNSSHTNFFEQQLLYFFGGKTGVFDIDPGIEGAFRRMAAEARNFGEGLNKEITPQLVFVDHGVDGVRGVTKGLDGSDLGEFGGTCKSVQNEKIHSIKNMTGVC